MDNLPLALIMSHRNTSGEAFSALPNAPVVDTRGAVSTAAPRTHGDGGGLYRLGDLVAPPRPARGFRTLG